MQSATNIGQSVYFDLIFTSVSTGKFLACVLSRPSIHSWDALANSKALQGRLMNIELSIGTPVQHVLSIEQHRAT